jgi:2-oxo-4-hydroxy-4-carboxy-5-ureidoimidazoline decarboxylase
MAGSPDALARLNRLPAGEARAEFLRCCGSRRWAEAMLAGRPYPDVATLFAAAERAWAASDPEDRLEALRHHPRIGDRAALEARFAASRSWSAAEQQGVAAASAEVLDSLAEGNRLYESRFGHVFLVCATGKTAPEMLALLRERLGNDPETELRIAAEQQSRITRLRLERLLQEASA